MGTETAKEAPRVEVRLLEPGEAALLTNVAPEVFDDPLHAHAVQKFLSDTRHHLAVALDGDLVIGFASAVVYVHPDKPRSELWINEVGIASKWQAQGIGKALLSALLQHARARGCAEAWVTAEHSNEPARRLYASLGGNETSGLVMYTFQLMEDGAYHSGQ